MASLGKKLSKKRTGLRPNWDNDNAETCCCINYFSDSENTKLILLRQEIQIQNEYVYCNELLNTGKKFKKWVFGHLTKM